jgi:hypothetical protein
MRGGAVVTIEPPFFLNVAMVGLDEEQKSRLGPLSLVPGEFVIPVPSREPTKQGTKRKPQKTQGEYFFVSAAAAEHRLGVSCFVAEHDVTLAFACTDYKLQGQTMDSLIMVFEPGSVPKMASFYVLSTRVTTGARLFLDYGGRNIAHLADELHHSHELAVWERSYDKDGMFDRSLAARRNRELAERLQAAQETKAAEGLQARRARSALYGKGKRPAPANAKAVPTKANAKAAPAKANAKAAPAKANAKAAAAPAKAASGPESHVWDQNSCSIDAALELLIAAGFPAQCTDAPCSATADDRSAAQCALDNEVHAWVLARSLRASSIELTVLRDNVRRSLLRVDAEVNGRGMSDADIAPYIDRYASVVSRLNCILMACRAPTHMRFHTDVVCRACGDLSTTRPDSHAVFTYPLRTACGAMQPVSNSLSKEGRDTLCAICQKNAARTVRRTSETAQCLYVDTNAFDRTTDVLQQQCTLRYPAGAGASAECVYDLVAVCYHMSGDHFVAHTRSVGEADAATWHEFDALARDCDGNYIGRGTTVGPPDGRAFPPSVAVYCPRLPRPELVPSVAVQFV